MNDGKLLCEDADLFVVLIGDHDVHSVVSH